MTTPPKRSGLLVQLQRFSLVGVANTLLDFVVYALLVRAGVHYLAAQVLSYACGLACSFLLNRSWTFGYRRGEGSLILPKFLVVNLCAWAVLELALFILVGKAGVAAIAGKVLATPFSLAVNFAGSRYWVFRSRTAPMSEPSALHR